MKLYLSSYRLGNGIETLLTLLGGGRRVAMVGNALDLIPNDQREHHRDQVYDPAAEFAGFGLEADELDLRDYFTHREGLADTLANYDLVWVLGGNSFVLRRAMMLSGFDRTIHDALARGVVYGGFSAGAVVATPTLHGIELMDEPLPVPAGYSADVIWEGLGLIDFSIVPHVKSAHPETELAALALTNIARLNMPHRALRDGEVIVRDGDTISLVGSEFDR